MSTPARFCPQCGTPAAQYAMICSNCGKSLSEASSVPPTQYASPPPGVPPTQYASPPSTDPYGSPAYGASAPSTDPYGSPAYGASVPSTDPYGSSAYGASSTPAANPYSSSPYEVSSAPPPPASGGAPGPRKGPPVIAIVGAVVLLIVLLGGGIFFFTAGKKTTTSTTTSAASTATAEASQALFFDNFANNSKGWVTGKSAGSSQTISNNMLTLEDHQPNDSIFDFLPTNAPFSDFKLVVTFTMEQGDKNDVVGISLRSDSSFNHEYHVQFDGGQNFEIGKSYLDSSGNVQGKALSDYAPAAALKPVGQPNTITVVMKGNTLVLLINGSVVKTVTDSDYATGQIALYVIHGNTSSAVKASFSSVAVYPPPFQLPS